MSSLSRRALLKTFAGVGAASAFSRLFTSDPAYGADVAPLRLISLFTPHGQVPQLWRPQGTETNFNIEFANATLAPLAPFKDKLLILDGLDFKVLYEYGRSGHEGGPVSFLTGSRVVESGGDYLPSGPSLDQYLAKRVGTATKFPSLELVTYQQFEGQHVYNTLSFTQTGSRVPFERDPNKVFNRLFANLVVPGTDPAADQALARKKSILDFVSKDATRLRDRLNGDERQKLENHLTVIRNMESRLTSLATGCSKPGKPAVPALSDINNAPKLLGLHLDLIAQAFACDLTRIVTLFGSADNPGMPWLNLNMSIHDDLAHQLGSGNTEQQASTALKLGTAHRWYAEQVAGLMTRLAAIPEGNGTVLDNTIILWGNELGDPAGHGSVDIPTVIAGGAGGKLKMGRYLQLRTSKNPLQGWSGFGQKAPAAFPHNRLLITLAQAFGQQIETFGQAEYTGAIPGLLA